MHIVHVGVGVGGVWGKRYAHVVKDDKFRVEIDKHINYSLINN